VAREWRFLGRFGIAIVLAAIVLDLGSGGMIRDTAQRTLGDWVLEQRAALMLAGILMFLQHPWVGVGLGGYAESLDHVGAQVFWLWDFLPTPHNAYRSEEHTSELQSREKLVCRLLLEKKKR